MIIIVVAALLTATALGFFSYSSQNVQRSAVSATNTNAQVEVHDLANILASKMVSITDNLGVLSASRPVMALNATGAQPLLDAAQTTTSNFTTAYSLFNAKGSPIASSNETSLRAASGQVQANFSQAAFFKGAESAGTAFTDPEYYSVASNSTFIVISQPVYEYSSGAKAFAGVLVGGVSFTSLVKLINGQLAPQVQGSIGVVDYKGTVLYGNPSANEGENLFSPYIRSLVETALPGPGTGQFYGFINDSLSGAPALSDFAVNGITIALASAPITYGQVLGNLTDQRLFAAVYVTAPSTLAAGQAGEITQLQLATGSSISGIVGAAVISSVVVLRRNRALGKVVKEKTAELEKSLKTSELMQDILTHDIRNYNQVSLFNIELLKGEIADGGSNFDRAQTMTFADSALRAIEGSTRLVEKAKTLGRIASDRQVRLRPIDLGAALQSAINLVAEANPKKSLKVTASIQPDARVLADDLLGEAFANLLSNSVRYTERDEVNVEISAEEVTLEAPEKKLWKVTFADHGKGIQDDQKQELFSRYLKTAQGSGLGLSIVYALVVERYSGRLKVSDRVSGDYTQGTKAEVWLPTAP